MLEKAVLRPRGCRPSSVFKHLVQYEAILLFNDQITIIVVEVVL